MLRRFDFARPRAVVAWTVLFGALAGLVAATYYTIAAEPLIDDAILIEEEMEHLAGAGHEHGEDEQVSRSTQSGVGLFGAYALTGAALGLLMAVSALALRGDWLTPLRRFAIAGVILAGAIHVAPWLKYPPNPPAVGDEDTVGERTLTYLVLILLIGVVLAATARLSGQLRRVGWDDAARTATVALAGAVAVAAVLVAMPANTTEISAEFSEAALALEMSPASLVWRFRTASLIGDLLLWGVLAVGAGFAFSPSPAKAEVPSTSASTAPA